MGTNRIGVRIYLGSKKHFFRYKYEIVVVTLMLKVNSVQQIIATETFQKSSLQPKYLAYQTQCDP